MANFMKKMKSAAEQAKIKDHPLFTGEYSAEVRNAYFSGCAASLCFLDDNLDADEQKNLQFFGQSLRLTSADVEDSIKTVREIGDDDKMEFLQEIFSLMDTDYLKYALLTDIHTLCMKKGSLTDDEKDFINTAAEILFGEEKDMFQLWEKGLTLENIIESTSEAASDSVEDENVEEDMSQWYENFKKDLEKQKADSDQIFKEAYSAISDVKKAKIKAIIAKQLSCSAASLTDDTNLITDLGADSLDQVELVMALEEEFGVDIPDEDAEHLKTIGEILRYAEKISKDM